MSVFIGNSGVITPGTDYSGAVTSTRCRLNSLTVLFTTSSAVANRFVTIAIRDASENILWQSENNVAQIAGVTCQYSFARGAMPPQTPPSTTSTVRGFSLPEFALVAGQKINTYTLNMDETDSYGTVYYQLEDLPTIG